MTPKRPLVIGLTGSIGMGKTTTARMFQELGIPAFDADAAVHRLYEPGGAAVASVAEAFPGTRRNNAIDRAALGARLAANPASLQRLEAIVHPFVAIEQEKFLEEAISKGVDLVVLDIPLLFETRDQNAFDALVVVSAPEPLQRARVMSRAGMTEEKFGQFSKRQLADAEKRAQAEFIVETGQGFDHARAQVQRIVAALRDRRQEKNRA